MNTIENVSRRSFLRGGVITAGALVLGVRLYPDLERSFRFDLCRSQRRRHGW
jgi:hypothetical protein